MDELLHSVQAYEKMLKKSYDIVLGKKGTAENIHIAFRKDGFHHLIGLQYLQQNMPELRKDKENIFHRILKEKRFREKIENALEYNEILSRVISVNYLEQLLDSPDTEVYKCNKGRGSSIEADYMFKGKVGSDTVYFFIRESKNEKGIYQGCSIFPEEKQKSGHSYVKVLHKVKHDLLGTHELYISPNYHPQSANNIMQMQFDNPISDNTLAVNAFDSFKEALSSLAERFRTFIQNIADKIQETLAGALKELPDADTTPSEQKPEHDEQNTESTSAPAPEKDIADDDEFIIRDVYSVFADSIGTQGYENYMAIVPADKLDFQIPFFYETEQVQITQELEQDIQVTVQEFKKKQAEYDDF